MRRAPEITMGTSSYGATVVVTWVSLPTMFVINKLNLVFHGLGSSARSVFYKRLTAFLPHVMNL